MQRLNYAYMNILDMHYIYIYNIVKKYYDEM